MSQADVSEANPRPSLLKMYANILHALHNVRADSGQAAGNDMYIYLRWKVALLVAA